MFPQNRLGLENRLAGSAEPPPIFQKSGLYPPAKLSPKIFSYTLYSSITIPIAFPITHYLAHAIVGDRRSAPPNPESRIPMPVESKEVFRQPQSLRGESDETCKFCSLDS